MHVHQTNNIIDSRPTQRERLTHRSTGISAVTTDAELKALGFLPLVYVGEAYDSATQIRTGPTGCNMGDPVSADADSVTGTYTVSDKPPEPVPGDDDYDHKKLRRQKIAETLGDGSMNEAIGQQLDVIWKALNVLQMNGTIDLPTEADTMVGQLMSIKGQYPKPGA